MASVATKRWFPAVRITVAPNDSGEPEMGVTVPSGLVWNSDTLPVEALAANTNVLCWGVAPPLPGEVPGVAMGIFDSPWQPAIKNNKKNVKTSRQRVTNDDFIISEPGEGEVLVVKSEEINSRTGWLSKVKFDEDTN